MNIYQNIQLEIGSQKWIHCNYCNNHTHHKMLHSHRSKTWVYQMHTMEVLDSELYDEKENYLEFRLWGCLGCDTCVMEIIYNQSEPLVPEATYLPPRQLHGVRQKEFHLLPSKLRRIYSEVCHCFNHSLHILCAVGIRALLEGICADKRVQGKTLFKQIDNLKNHHLPPNIVDALHSFRFIGNDAVHELEAPSQYVLKQCIEVLEDLLNYFYQLEYKTQGLPRKKPKT